MQKAYLRLIRHTCSAQHEEMDGFNAFFSIIVCVCDVNNSIETGVPFSISNCFSSSFYFVGLIEWAKTH